MTEKPDRTDMPIRQTVISVDAMGGDSGVGAVIGGMALSARKNSEIRFIVHGATDQIAPLLKKKPDLARITVIRDSGKVIAMDEKPSRALRSGKGSSMWNAVESVREGEALAAVSCGNTGALMAISMLRLRKMPGVSRPAIAVLWPSRNPHGKNIILDMGADIRADANDLLQYAIMGASYARNALGLKRPRIGLLNVGTEENKGRPEIQEAAGLVAAVEETGNLEYIGFVEGSDLPSDRVDVIVTDGFTGNVALKASEGTAKLFGDWLKAAFSHSILARLSALIALPALKRLKKRVDPRRFNGGVFLGLNGTVIKSHGGADAIGVSAAIKLAFTLAHNDFAEKLAARVASGVEASQDALRETSTTDGE